MSVFFDLEKNVPRMPILHSSAHVGLILSNKVFNSWQIETVCCFDYSKIEKREILLIKSSLIENKTKIIKKCGILY